MTNHRRTLGVGTILGFLASLLVATTATTSAATTVEPDLVAGNPTCLGLGYDYGFKPNSGGDEDAPGDFDNGVVDVSWEATATKGDGGVIELSWTSDPAASAVIVKAGDNANVYRYDPASSGDSGLITPDNAGGNQAGLSHLEFCYYATPTVSKTANTSFTRTYTWDIVKNGDATELLLSVGQTHTVNYDVVVTRSTPVDSDFNVAGVVTIHNPWPMPLSITSVTDSLVDGELDCTDDEVAPGGTVTCDYSADVADGTGGTNTATVKTKASYSAPERTTVATAPYTFGTPTTVVDDCVSVDDDKYGDLGATCGTTTYEYSMDVGPYASPGTYSFTNEACFETNTTGSTGCDDHTVVITVPGGGCTLTQGYWKTHSAHGPAPYDAAWGNLGAAQHNTAFFGSGKTWYQVFWTPPQGNAYFILAHQYMAAKLNVLDGASAPAAVTAALASAEALFTAQGSSTKLSKTATTSAKALATTLDAYNNGLTGPGHCSE